MHILYIDWIKFQRMKAKGSASPIVVKGMGTTGGKKNDRPKNGTFHFLEGLPLISARFTYLNK